MYSFSNARLSFSASMDSVASHKARVRLASPEPIAVTHHLDRDSLVSPARSAT